MIHLEKKKNEYIRNSYNKLAFKKAFQTYLAAYLANQYMLGEGEEAWEFVDRTYRERDRLAYFYLLSMYLCAGGYSH